MVNNDSNFNSNFNSNSNFNTFIHSKNQQFITNVNLLNTVIPHRISDAIFICASSFSDDWSQVQRSSIRWRPN